MYVGLGIGVSLMIFTGFKSDLLRPTEEISTFSHAESSQIRWLSSLISDNVPPALHMHEVQYLEAIVSGKGQEQAPLLKSGLELRFTASQKWSCTYSPG